MALHPSVPHGAGLIAGLVLAVVTAPTAFSRAYYVAPSGSDTNGGLSWGDAKKTIQAGINLAAPAHETVLVAKGTYFERIVVPAQVTLEGGYAGPGTANPDLRDPAANPTIIDASNGGSVVTLSDGDVVRGFTLQHGDARAPGIVYGGGIYAMNVANVVVRDCRIADCSADYGGGVYISGSPATDAIGGVANVLSGITFSNNLTAHNGGAVFADTGSVLISHSVMVSGQASFGGGVCLNGSGLNTVVHDNLIRSNGAYIGGGIFVNGGQSRIYNNTIHANTDFYNPVVGPYAGGGGIYLSDDAIATVMNNIITNNTSGLRANGQVVVARNNDAWANTLFDFSDTTVGAFSADPYYANPDGGDFTLLPSSICRNSGKDDFYNPLWPDASTDLAGRPRLMGTHVDVGAYEIPEATPVSLVVPGHSNPWLAGMPYGSTAKGDTAYESSPAQLPAVLTPGTAIRFAATGSVSYDGGAHAGPPDGDPGEFFTDGADNGIAGVTAVVNCLLGVFLDNTQPDATPAPAALSFANAASLDFSILQPALKQVFFIGDGKTSGGAQQSVIVPAGATRLYLGTLDGTQWSNNSGQFDVTSTLQLRAAPFTWVDVLSVLKMAGGLSGTNGGDMSTYDLDERSPSNWKVDLMDAAQLARKVGGLEPNP